MRDVYYSSIFCNFPHAISVQQEKQNSCYRKIFWRKMQCSCQGHPHLFPCLPAPIKMPYCCIIAMPHLLNQSRMKRLKPWAWRCKELWVFWQQVIAPGGCLLTLGMTFGFFHCKRAPLWNIIVWGFFLLKKEVGDKELLIILCFYIGAIKHQCISVRTHYSCIKISHYNCFAMSGWNGDNHKMPCISDRRKKWDDVLADFSKLMGTPVNTPVFYRNLLPHSYHSCMIQVMWSGYA